MNTWFKVAENKFYLDVAAGQQGEQNNSAGKIICCVDVSGSMNGPPIDNVNRVLSEIYDCTGISHPLFCFNDHVSKRTMQEIRTNPLQSGGWTDFSKVFDSMRDELVSSMTDTTFIFMTDGQHTGGKECLIESLNAFKLVMSMVPSTVKIVVHVIGFGDVSDNFLDSIRKLGNKEGLFRYSTQSIDLGNDFNEMFNYASARECILKIGNSSYEVMSNAESVGFLVSENLSDEQIASAIQVKLGKDAEWTSIKVKQLDDGDISPLHRVKAINMIVPTNEQEVKDILVQLNGVASFAGNTITEKMDVEQLKKDISSRMMEYVQLFTQIKMGQVPEQVKLKLNALRHAGKFSDTARQNKLDLRVNKNVEYFKKTDIAGILEGFKRDMTTEAWSDISALSGRDSAVHTRYNWTCDLSGDDLYDIMKCSSDNVLCLGLYVKRDATAIDSPSAGMKLLNVSNILVSFDKFIQAMSTSPYKDESNPYCLIEGQKVNGVFPLYIHKEHFKRIRILEGLWLGHLYTLDSYGYHKSQEVALLKLLHDIIGNKVEEQLLPELFKVAKFIIEESEGFKTEYGMHTYENFIRSIHGRVTCRDLIIPLMIGEIKDDRARVDKAVYLEHVRRQVTSRMSDVERRKAVERLLYGEQVKTVTVQTRPLFVHDPNDPEYLERTYIKFFQNKEDPSPVIPETISGQQRRNIVEPDADYIYSFLTEIPDFMRLFDTTTVVSKELFTPEELRKELLLMLDFNTSVPSHVTVDNVISFLDSRLQGNVEDQIEFDIRGDNLSVLANVADSFKTVEGFAGLLMKYCPKRCGVIFDAIVKRLIGDDEIAKDASVNMEVRKNKLEALLKNVVPPNGTLGERCLYTRFAAIAWNPLVDMIKIMDVVGVDLVKEIEKAHVDDGKKMVHRYRLSNKPNRHGHSNHCPNMHNLEEFKGYDYKEADFMLV